jgi:hypothetical protein
MVPGAAIDWIIVPFVSKFGCKNTSFWGVKGVKVVKRS